MRFRFGMTLKGLSIAFMSNAVPIYFCLRKLANRTV